jgi:hypothetical protein
MMIIASYIHCIIKFAKSGNILTVPVRSCAVCGYLGCLHRHGCYSRNLIILSGCYRIFIQRYKCPCCGKTCSVRPFFILPYFQYSYFVIFSILLESFVIRHSYTRIVSTLLALDSSSSISKSHISFYCKRFRLCCPHVNIFLYSEGIFPDWSATACRGVSNTLKGMMNYTISGGNFPHAYHCSLHKFFMQKL